MIDVAFVDKVVEDHNSVEKHVSQPVMLYDFRKEVEAAIPGCRTTARGDGQCWVYMPDDHLTMGLIGFGNNTNNGRGASGYFVRSRTITNSKYASGSKQRNMVTSTNRAVAVKNAKKFLRRWSPREIMDATKQYPRDAITNMRNTLRMDINKREAALFGGQLSNRKDAPLVAEVRHLFNSGHTFLDPSIPQQLTQYFGLWDEEFNLQHGHHANFVAISVSHGRQRFDVVPVDSIDQWYPKNIGETETYYEDVPEHILGRLSVLSMVEDGVYVHGVGYRHTAGLFYVAR